MALNVLFQFFSSQTVKLPQSLSKYNVVRTIRIELGNFFISVITGHEKLLNKGQWSKTVIGKINFGNFNILHGMSVYLYLGAHHLMSRRNCTPPNVKAITSTQGWISNYPHAGTHDIPLNVLFVDQKQAKD